MPGLLTKEDSNEPCIPPVLGSAGERSFWLALRTLLTAARQTADFRDDIAVSSESYSVLCTADTRP